jgi:hypothetical protein
VQFALTAFTLVVPPRFMFGMWLAAALVVGAAATRIESYKQRHVDWGVP